MKIWTAEHIYEHPWDTVVTAAQRKYPNPLNPNVTGLDVVERTVDSKGVLHSHRLMSTEWGLPDWAIRLVGINKPCYVSEHSEINPVQKWMKLKSRNLTFSNLMTIEERLSYEANPQDPNTTLMKQEAVITVQGIPLTSYVESIVERTCNNNAVKGRQAMEWVIGKIKTEAMEFSRRMEQNMEDLNKKAQTAQRNMEDLSRKALEDMETIIPPPPKTSQL